MSLASQLSDYRVSSVLNNERKQFGKKFIFDGNDETCWNSDKGSPQWIEFSFKDEEKTISSIILQFQGGFTGKGCILEAYSSDSEDKISPTSRFEFFPLDSNAQQEFNLKDQTLTSKKFKLTFNSSTDFYGRIILYKLDFIFN